MKEFLRKMQYIKTEPKRYRKSKQTDLWRRQRETRQQSSPFPKFYT